MKKILFFLYPVLSCCSEGDENLLLPPQDRTELQSPLRTPSPTTAISHSPLRSLSTADIPSCSGPTHMRRRSKSNHPDAWSGCISSSSGPSRQISFASHHRLAPLKAVEIERSSTPVIAFDAEMEKKWARIRARHNRTGSLCSSESSASLAMLMTVTKGVEHALSACQSTELLEHETQSKLKLLSENMDHTISSCEKSTDLLRQQTESRLKELSDNIEQSMSTCEKSTDLLRQQTEAYQKLLQPFGEKMATIGALVTLIETGEITTLVEALKNQQAALDKRMATVTVLITQCEALLDRLKPIIETQDHTVRVLSHAFTQHAAQSPPASPPKEKRRSRVSSLLGKPKSP